MQSSETKLEVATPVRLELTPLMWIAITLVATLGIGGNSLQPPASTVLNCLEDGRRIPIRRSEPVQVFDQLGIQVKLPGGWTLLSTTPNDRTLRPTFVHVADACVIRLFPLNEIDPIESIRPKDEIESTDHRLGGAETRWITVRQTTRIEVANGGGVLPLSWTTLNPRRIGRWNDGNRKVGLVAITHSPPNILPKSVLEFCAGIVSLAGSPSLDNPGKSTLRTAK